MVSTEACAAVLDQLRRTTRQQRQLTRRLGIEHVTDAAVLGVVEAEGPLRLSDLAERLLVDASVTSRQVAALVAAGLLAREADPDDGRSRLLHVTDAGRADLARWRAVSSGLLVERLTGWDDAELRTLSLLLGRLNDALASTCTADVAPLLRPPADPGPATPSPAPTPSWSTS